MWWKILLLLLMSGGTIAAFLTPAPQQTIGDASRIFYYHIPQAWVCVLAFLLSMIYSIRYLRTRRTELDDKAVAAARLGFLFCVLATITGSVFARVTWGSFWNWDPRETSIFILLLIYGAYFALRGAIDEPQKRASLAAVYAVFAALTVPFLVFVVPRALPSLHPADSVLDENLSFTLGPTVRWVFLSLLAAFTLLFLWMLEMSVRARRLIRAREEREN